MESKTTPSGADAEEDRIPHTPSRKNSKSSSKVMVNDISALPAAAPSSTSVSPMKTKYKGQLSQDEALLESLDCRLNRPHHSGPFLTVQRRRRRRKYVRTYLFRDPTLIDDLSSYQTNFVLERINNWQFNAFILDNVTGGRPLPNLCVHLFKSYGLFDHFNLDPVTVWKLFSIIEDGYHWRNPYHNAVHAADVTQAMHCFLQETFILEKLTPLEIFSAIVAAVTHDLDHPGVNQPFLVATSNHLASLYKNSSVLENHHWRSAMGCLNESGVSAILGPEVVKQVETQIKELVLATDITRQPDFLATLKKHLDESTLDMNSPDIRQFVLQIALKCADISNPCRPWEISRKWSIKVCEEFFRQGDYERQLNLPVTPQFDRYSSSVPKIQIGFFNFIVQPLFVEWQRMMDTQLSGEMMNNLVSNKANWERLLVEETMQPTDQTERELIEIPQHLLADEDTISLNADIIAARKAFDDETAMQNVGDHELHRSVRFDTTITTASDSENSEGDEANARGLNTFDSDMLLIPRPDGRRHSIATGLMGSNIQLPPQFLSVRSHHGSSHSLSSDINPLLSPSSPSSRMVGRTVIRRESLPGSLLPGGKTLSTKTILHLQKIRLAAEGGSEYEVDLSPVASGEGEPSSSITAAVPVSPARIVERSSCSSSTTDEILDFTFSLPETMGGRSSGSPSRRLLHETTDFDELCPGTSILSMSPSVTQLQLQHGIADLEEQRRHLIRQQTCPVVSLNADGSFNRPRFLSAAAAISPTTAATSSIISQRMRNRSPESGAEGGQGASSEGMPGRNSGGSSSEALLCCEVISEEGDRQSTSSSSENSKNNSKSVSRSCSHEASPLEIFVQQFPPGSDDNDGEAPRRESGSLDTSEIVISSNVASTTTSTPASISTIKSSASNINPSDYSSPDNSSRISLEETLSSPSQHHHRKTQSTSSCSELGHCEPLEEDRLEAKRKCSVIKQGEDDVEEVDQREPSSSSKNNNTIQYIRQDQYHQHFTNMASTIKNPTGFQLNFEDEKENLLEDEIQIKYETCPGTSTAAIGGGSSSSRIATILMWRNNRLWRSLTEEADEHSLSSSIELQRRMYEKQLLPEYCTERWDLRFSQQQLHQGVVGSRLQIRRGSAPTTTPAMGCRGAQDRRSDPTQYHSSSCLTSCNNVKNTLSTFLDSVASCSCSKTTNTNKNQTRRGSVPVELIKQSIFRPIPSVKKQILPKSGRRGSLPCESATTNLESTYAHKWLHVFPYHEDDSITSLKRRSSGGPEIFAAAQRKMSTSISRAGENWRGQILIEQLDAPETSSSSTTGTTTAYWQGPRRGSLPVDVYISGGSCSSESESSGDASDT